ncbi:4-hydroxybenzoate octaprenyltransferase [Porticoccus sp. W117]|uniref:4-hydroxybenzoate octaprenyltransferase n=1 Tax=Porticoccus sp. W117 TaxID=3054777 RepID=UPI002599184F|nr:4-hydroxybenzoate octaprenyltransferase [Porticoccus sp. W117]MDM3870872.1 4-hydroxybenzoate octaprenyltransferase [Porticoccus sp. W117]
MTQTLKQRLPHFMRLMRFDKPIGTLLLLWPTLWALWLAAGGLPDWDVLVIFVLGVTLMRAAGCVINDYADRHIDGHVQRTEQRPIPSGDVAPREALLLFTGLALVAFLLVLFTNGLTVLLSLGGVLLAASYPFMKRYTYLPQVVLGAAFAWAIPMAFAAQTGELNPALWALYAGVVLWTVAYDTFYAMVDRDDDLKLGVKSTAILFGDQDRAMILALQILCLLALLLTGKNFDLGLWYYTGVAVATLLFLHQQRLTRNRDRDACFKAFLNNNWVGVAVFVGLVLDYQL